MLTELSTLMKWRVKGMNEENAIVLADYFYDLADGDDNAAIKARAHIRCMKTLGLMRSNCWNHEYSTEGAFFLEFVTAIQNAETKSQRLEKLQIMKNLIKGGFLSMKRYKTRREACEAWVHGFNAIPEGCVVKLIKRDMDDVREITPIRVNDDVEVLFGDDCGEKGVVCEIDGDVVTVLIDSAQKKIKKSNLEVQHDDILPMWGTMWSFGDSLDDHWLENMGGLQIMADLGFRIYEQEDYGYIFGIDGAGFSFYDEFWIPLYCARGLRWSEEDEAEGEGG